MRPRAWQGDTLTAAKRAARPGGLIVIGMALIALGISLKSIPFIAAGGLFFILGAVDIRKSR